MMGLISRELGKRIGKNVLVLTKEVFIEGMYGVGAQYLREKQKSRYKDIIETAKQTAVMVQRRDEFSDWDDL